MALTGFDPEVVNTSINSVKNAYESLIHTLGDEMQTQFVGGIADKWACNYAQKFFVDGFKPSVDGLITDSNIIFESVVNAMNQAAQIWAAETNSSYNGVLFQPIQKQIDASLIQENIGGIRGIDLAEANNVASKLPMIAENAKSALTSAQQAVENCGFMGGNQSGNLSASLGIIKTNIDRVVQDITTVSKAYIEKTVESYSNTEGQISRAFQSQ